MIQYFQRYCVSFKQALAVIPTFKGSQFASPVAAIHSMNYPISITKEQLQSLILSNLLCFCRTGIVARKYKY